MTTLSSATAKPTTLSSSSIFLASYRSHSQISPQTPTPLSFNFNFLSDGSNLPPIPSNFPHSKIIPNTRFIVDGFRSAGDFSVSYFLTHFHADHYTGLNPNWCRGVVFCSDITANLLVESLNVSPLFVVPLPLDETVQIDGCDVTAVDANHCPGAVQFLFRLADRQRYIHTGDFRFKTSMKSDPNLCRFVGADAVFLDTTYCNPKFVFPSQEESVDYIASTITRIRDRNEESGEPMLFLIATYVIGKEKILLEIARRCNVLLHVDAKKLKILSILGLGDSGIFTEDSSATNVHVIGWNLLGETWPYFRPNFAKMKEIMEERGYSKAVGFVSTGWMYETKRDGFSVRAKDLLEIHLAPYSEHSNYDELREYVRFLRPKRVIPTVGADVEKLDGKHALTMQKHFVGLVDETANKEEFLMPFRQMLVESDARPGDAKANIGGKPEDVEERRESVLKLLQIEEGSSLLVTNVQNEENIEGAVNELRDCLPSWVSHDQIMCLLKGSGGDIVGAVSEFFENETVFYEQVNACEKSVSSKQESVHDVFDSLSHQKPAQIDLDCKKNSNKEKNPKSQNLAIPSSKLPKKRGSGNGNKPRKKGKSSSPLESSGRKQSTITKYFGRVGSLTSSASDEGGTSTTGQHLKNGKALIVDTAETHKEDLDRFLQIINGGMERDAAASLLEKAKGNIDVAVDIYYSKSNSASGNEGILVSCSLQSEMHDCLTSSFTVKSSNLYEETTNSPTLFMQRTSVEDPTMTCVSLSIDNFSPIEHACWKAGQPAAYLHLARTFDLVEREKGKIKTTLMLCNMFRSLLALSPEDVLPALYLCTNKIAADHENMELNIGGTMVIAALEEACGTSRSNIKEMYKIYGDLGDVAQECRQSQSLLAPPRPLSVHSLFCILRKISTETGSGSAVRRKNLVVNLMRSCREMEIKFLVRTLVRNLRIGATMRTILPALAQAVVLNSSSEHHLGSPESLKLRLQGISAAIVEAYNIAPSLDLLVPSLLNEGINFSASSVLLAPGTPIPPMLARITNGIIQVLKLFEGRAFTCEYKYDGQRAQIHRLADGTIRVFSRNMKENTFKFPDLISIIKESCNPAVLSFILDAEIVAVDRKNGIKLMSFQELSSRERGSKEFAVNADSIKVDICIFLFDIMLFNGKRLLALPLRQRRDYLKDLLHMEKKGYLEFAKEITVEADETCCDNQSTLFRVNSFFEDACKSSCEGIMVKSLDIDAGYCASKRSEAWLKVKRDYVEGLGDSLDLVPIGAWHGNGRKAGWYSPFLMACYNPNAEEYQSVCRVMSGFSDSFYSEMKEFFSGERMLTKKPPYYRTDESPDLWFSPELVWEIRGADFTISPVHHAAVGLVHPSRGISVRLPRYVRPLPDRRPEGCSTSADIACMFQSQTRKMEVKTED